ncbi:hypothetical protein scyTo_0017904 [Scyliorhinus torazame]|uniref:Uncharacterized protein n=1 Tax=Scyliorhinus torazame TaxID=75743 RepID=A0A401Q2G3_SCYTO|nr:hypothetical protein [Scyliorhinus torazame]
MITAILIVLHFVLQEVLKQLQGSIEDEALASAGQVGLLEQIKELNLECANSLAVKLSPKMSLHSYGSREGSMSGRSGECSPVPIGSVPRRGLVNGSRESTGYLEELEKERIYLVGTIFLCFFWCAPQRCLLFYTPQRTRVSYLA